MLQANQKAELAELQPPFHTAVLAGVDLATPLLPSTYRNRQHMVRLVRHDVGAFLEHDLNVGEYSFSDANPQG